MMYGNRQFRPTDEYAPEYIFRHVSLPSHGTFGPCAYIMLLRAPLRFTTVTGTVRADPHGQLLVLILARDRRLSDITSLQDQ